MAALTATSADGLDQHLLKQCARCKQDRPVAVYRDDGPICRNCYHDDPLFQQACGKCGR